jgi:F0F1-type ATP synthase assembly protein I
MPILFPIAHLDDRVSGAPPPGNSIEPTALAAGLIEPTALAAGLIEFLVGRNKNQVRRSVAASGRDPTVRQTTDRVRSIRHDRPRRWEGFALTENDSKPSERREPESQLSRETIRSEVPEPESSHRKSTSSGAVLRFATLGTELAAFTLTFTAIGYFLDSYRGHDHRYATAFGTLIGFTLGLVRFISMVRKDQN